MTYDQWKTRGPEECSFCHSEGHTKRYCSAWKELKAEADEMYADMLREEPTFGRRSEHGSM